jgi:hypothetical protein
VRLIRHPGIVGMLPHYTIVGVSASDLALLQLLLIEAGQPELRTGEDWVARSIYGLRRADALDLLADAPEAVREAIRRAP